ncbi:MAG: hypothetical protein R2764_13440 [Bacteroidales bacterium]
MQGDGIFTIDIEVAAINQQRVTFPVGFVHEGTRVKHKSVAGAVVLSSYIVLLVISYKQRFNGDVQSG